MPVCWTPLRRMKIIGHRQAGDSCPAVANLKQPQPVYEPLHLLFAETWLEDKGEKTRRTSEVPLPEFMSRARRERRVQHAFDFRTFCQPSCQGKPGFCDRLQAHWERLHST